MLYLIGTLEKNETNTERNYRIMDTPIGKIVYFEFEGLTQWKNLTNGDILWTTKPTEVFEDIHNGEPVTTFVSKRLNGFSPDEIKIIGESKYYLVEKKITDGYLYEIPATTLRSYPKKDYPEMQFPYTKYKISTISTLDYASLIRLKEEETIKYNGSEIHSYSDISMICDEVYKYCKNKI